MTLYDPRHIEHLLGQCTPLCFIWYLETKNTNPPFKTRRAVVWSKQDASIMKVCFPVQYAHWTSQLYFKLYFLLQQRGKTCFRSDLSLLSIAENLFFVSLFFFFFFLMWASPNVQSNAVYFRQLHLPVILYPWNEGCWGIRQHILRYNQVLQCDFQWFNIGYVHISVLSSLFRKWVRV